jgi:hypothetical protein
VVVSPVDPVRPKRLADALLGGVVAAVGTDLANKPAHPACGFYLYFEARLQEKIEAGSRFAGEGKAVLPNAAVRELDNQPCPALTCLRLGMRRVAHASHREQA